MSEGGGEGPLGRRLLWFVGLWAGGVAAVGLLAWVLRLWMRSW